DDDLGPAIRGATRHEDRQGLSLRRSRLPGGIPGVARGAAGRRALDLDKRLRAPGARAQGRAVGVRGQRSNQIAYERRDGGFWLRHGGGGLSVVGYRTPRGLG